MALSDGDTHIKRPKKEVAKSQNILEVNEGIIELGQSKWHSSFLASSAVGLVVSLCASAAIDVPLLLSLLTQLQKIKHIILAYHSGLTSSPCWQPSKDGGMKRVSFGNIIARS